MTVDPAFVIGGSSAWKKEDQFGETLQGCGIPKLPWTQKAASEAAQFNKTDLDRVFVITAATAPHHIDYLKQAPVLAVQFSSRAPANTRDSNKYLSSITENVFRSGPKLRDLLNHRSIARPLRTIHSAAWRVSSAVLLPYFWNVPPSTLAQAIPKSKTRQSKWLLSLEQWLNLTKMSVCSQWLFSWACVALGDGKLRRDIETVADFARAQPMRFTNKWTWEKAAEECEVWHRDLAKKQDRQKFLKQHGIDWDEKINYLPLPSKRDILGISFEALQSGEDIHIEGSIMRHCVASYIDRIIERSCFVYSVRVGAKRFATLEIKPVSPTNLKLAQIKGPCNSKPTRDIVQAAQLFVDSINKSLKPEAT